MRRFFITMLATLGVSGAAGAQRPERPPASPPASDPAAPVVPVPRVRRAPPAPAPPAAPRDATATVAPDDGIKVDFQNADIRAVITALATAGGLNVTYGDLPSKRITLRLNDPVPRSAIRNLLRDVALSYGLRVTEDAGLMAISGNAGGAPPPSAPHDTGGVVGDFYAYRLRHANATRAAFVLQAMFNAGGPRGTGPGRQGVGQGQGLGQGQGNGNGFGRGMRGRIGNNGVGIGLGNNGGQGGGNGDGGQGGGGGGGGRNATGILIVPDEMTNSLLIRAADDDWPVIRRAIETIDLRPLQVIIEVMIAEVRRNDDLNVGISGTSSGTRKGTVANGRFGPLFSAADSGDNFLVRLTHTGTVDVDLTLQALRQRGDVRILSLPLVFAQNNRQSTLVVGTQRPFVQTVRTLATDNTARDQVVEYKDVGTVLDIIPTINPDGYVNLQVYQEVSSATSEVQFGAPVISTRQAQASVFVRTGQTIVVGGLTDRQEQNIRSGIPLLSQIPLLGGLFGSTHKISERTELYLFLTPHVVESDADAEHIRSEIGAHSQLLHQVPVDSLRVIDRGADRIRARDTTVAPHDPVQRLSPESDVPAARTRRSAPLAPDTSGQSAPQGSEPQAVGPIADSLMKLLQRMGIPAQVQPDTVRSAPGGGGGDGNGKNGPRSQPPQRRMTWLAPSDTPIGDEPWGIVASWTDTSHGRSRPRRARLA